MLLIFGAFDLFSLIEIFETFYVCGRSPSGATCQDGSPWTIPRLATCPKHLAPARRHHRGQTTSTDPQAAARTGNIGGHCFWHVASLWIC